MPGFSGQGIVSLAKRLPSGLPGPFRDFGNAPEFVVGLTEESIERNESRTGQRLPLRKLTTSRAGTLSIKGDEFNTDNFALAIQGVVAQVAAGSAVNDFELPTGLVAGDVVALPGKNVSAVSIVDSTSGAPKTLPPAQYGVDAFPAEIVLFDLTSGGPYVQPFKVDFTPGAHQTIGAFQATTDEYFIRLKGINTETGVRGICDVYRVKIPATTALALINNEFLDWDLQCEILADLTRQAIDPGGQFFGFSVPVGVA